MTIKIDPDKKLKMIAAEYADEYGDLLSSEEKDRIFKAVFYGIVYGIKISNKH